MIEKGLDLRCLFADVEKIFLVTISHKGQPLTLYVPHVVAGRFVFARIKCC